MPRYRCTDEDGSYEKIYKAVDADDAAEEWAAHAETESAGEWRSGSTGACVVQEIDDKDVNIGDPMRFRIEVDWSPTFWAHEK